jgi:hypothetical protein
VPKANIDLTRAKNGRRKFYTQKCKIAEMAEQKIYTQKCKMAEMAEENFIHKNVNWQK